MIPDYAYIIWACAKCHNVGYCSCKIKKKGGLMKKPVKKAKPVKKIKKK